MKAFAASDRLFWIAAAAIHFGLANLVLPLTAAVLQQAPASAEGGGAAVGLLVRATKLLHFPLVTLALYPREWFPGDWVYLPMAVNSLMWGLGVWWIAGIYRRTR